MDGFKATVCTRSHTSGPCNGWPRADCPGFTRWWTDQWQNRPDLVRYGIDHEPKPWLLVPMHDGYWTPWHIAQAEIDRLRALLEMVK